MIISSVFVVSLISFRFYGIDGACVGAALAWAVGLFYQIASELEKDNARIKAVEQVVAAIKGR